MFNLLDSWFRWKELRRCRKDFLNGDLLVDQEKLKLHLIKASGIRSFKTTCGKRIERFGSDKWAIVDHVKFLKHYHDLRHQRYSWDKDCVHFKDCVASLQSIISMMGYEIDLFSIKTAGFRYKDFLK